MSFRASTLPSFSPPGNLDDLVEKNKEIWSEQRIGKWMDDEIAGGMNGPCKKPRTPLPQFFNGTVTAFEGGQHKTVDWNAFPNQVKLRYKTAPLIWQMADASRLVQDEYLEWSVQRRPSDGKITSVTFTCEGPEYWQFIADYQSSGEYPGAKSILDLYKELNPEFANDIQEEDLYLVNEKTGAKVYNPMNYWNQSSESGCIAHLCHPSNTLSAEIDIAAQATVLRMDPEGALITDANKLINCSKYGRATRNSDPVIGSAINSLARGDLEAGSAISVADPVALYIQSFKTGSLTLPTGPDDDQQPIPEGTVTFTRGRIGSVGKAINQGAANEGSGMFRDVKREELSTAMRVTVKVPEGVKDSFGTQLVVGDIFDSTIGDVINYGSQLALHITMGVSAVEIPEFQIAAKLKCPCDDSNKRIQRPEDMKHVPTTLLPIGVGFHGGKIPKDGLQSPGDGRKGGEQPKRRFMTR